MTQDYGPSYYDVQEAHHNICARHNVTIELLLVPNYTRTHGKAIGRWVACARVTTRGAKQELAEAAQEAFGQGGSLKTAPAALYRCLLRVDEQLEARSAAAAEQHAF